MERSFGPIELTVAIIIYAFFAYCLYVIGKKSGLAEKAWWGWVPLLQVLLMLQVAGVSWWWIFLFLVPFLNIVIGVIVWVKIAKNLNKPGWLGVLMFVPGIDLFVLGYLAFSR